MKFENVEYILEKMKPKDKREREIVKKLVAELGEFTNVKEATECLKVSKTYLYKMLEEENIIYFVSGRRKIIYTRSLLVILR